MDEESYEGDKSEEDKRRMKAKEADRGEKRSGKDEKVTERGFEKERDLEGCRSKSRGSC